MHIVVVIQAEKYRSFAMYLRYRDQFIVVAVQKNSAAFFHSLKYLGFGF